MRKKSVAIHIIAAAATVAGAAGAPSAVVNAVGNLLPMIVASTIFGFRRELEHESDVYAVHMLRYHGYDVMQVPAALDRLQKGPEVDLSEHSVFWSDHPKLADRVRDTTSIAQQLPPATEPARLEEQAFLVATKGAVRHDAGLAIVLGLPRSAVANAHRLLALEPNNAEYHVLLGDAYRTLGARTVEPTSAELSDGGKKQARKDLGKMTTAELERNFIDRPGGREVWQTNLTESEHAYAKALELDPHNVAALRGRGFLFEAQNRFAEAMESFSKYLEAAPEAKDATQVRRRIEALQRKLAVEPKPAPKQGATP